MHGGNLGGIERRSNQFLLGASIKIGERRTLFPSYGFEMRQLLQIMRGFVIP